MMNFRKLIAKVVLSFVGTVATVFSIGLGAQTYSFNMLEFPTPGEPITPVASLSITDIAGGAQFVLTANHAWLGSSSTISGLFFAGSGGSFGNYVGPSIEHGDNGFDFHAGGFVSQNLVFNWNINLPPPGAVLGNTGVLAFTITGDGVDSTDFSTPMMVHVQQLDAANTERFGSSNIKVVTAPIPEPEIYAMLVAGLGLMGFVARRRKQGSAAV